MKIKLSELRQVIQEELNEARLRKSRKLEILEALNWITGEDYDEKLLLSLPNEINVERTLVKIDLLQNKLQDTKRTCIFRYIKKAETYCFCCITFTITTTQI